MKISDIPKYFVKIICFFHYYFVWGGNDAYLDVQISIWCEEKQAGRFGADFEFF